MITGASSGIGAELAVQLGAQGARLSLFARRGAELARVAERAHAKGAADVRTRALDVADREATHAFLAEVEAAWDGIDLLVLNAGIGDNTYVEAFDDRLAARTIAVNSVAPMYAIGAVLPGMLRRRTGHIAGISSIASYRGLPGAAVYCASKACLSVLLEGLRIDLRRHGIHVTTVSPGFVRSAMTAKNRHPMPFLMDVEPAARRILRGIARRRREVRFPWPLALTVWLVRAMPDVLYDALASRVRRPDSVPHAQDPFGGSQ